MRPHIYSTGSLSGSLTGSLTGSLAGSLAGVLTSSLVALFGAASPMTAFAQETGQPTTVPAPATAAPIATGSATDRPARGSTMETVRARFGSPAQEQPAVGNPPITRWDYPGYAVYFEHDKVLHTVVVR